jgi:hypothetical protein
MLGASGSLVCLHSGCSSSRSPQQLSTFSRRCCKPTALPARSQDPGSTPHAILSLLCIAVLMSEAQRHLSPEDRLATFCEPHLESLSFCGSDWKRPCPNITTLSAAAGTSGYETHVQSAFYATTWSDTKPRTCMIQKPPKRTLCFQLTPPHFTHCQSGKYSTAKRHLRDVTNCSRENEAIGP